MANYNIFGKTIYIPDGLGLYILEKNKFETDYAGVLSKFEENAKFYMEPKSLLMSLKSTIECNLNPYINFLNKYGVYDLTVEDLFLLSQNYAHMLDLATNYYRYQNNIQERESIVRKANLAQAEYEAQSMVTGLSFGILSSSLTAHLVYAAQNEAKMKKQAIEAQEHFDKMSRSIEISSNNRIAKDCEQYYRTHFASQFRNALLGMYGEMFSFYIAKAAAILDIDLNDIYSQNYDFELAGRMVKRVGSNVDFQALIVAALTQCPYNLDVYLFAKKKKLLDDNLKTLLVKLELWEEFQSSAKPKKKSSNEIIAKEAIRMLLENEIDLDDSHWKQRATSYLADSKKLAEKYSESFVAHGLVAVHTIAVNLKTWNNLFWYDVDESIEKMIELFKPDDACAELWIDIAEKISQYTRDYIEGAHEYVSIQESEFSKQNPDATTLETERNDWIIKSNYKEYIGNLIMPMHSMILGLENAGISSDDWLIKNLKNDLLYYICKFLSPYDMWYSSPDRWVRIHLPLADREYAIGIYDDLIAEGVDKYDSGWYSLKKKDVYKCNDAFGDKPNTIWRGDVTRAGRKAQGRQSREELAEDKRNAAITQAVIGVLCVPLMLLFAFTDMAFLATISIFASLILLIVSGFTFKSWYKILPEEKKLPTKIKLKKIAIIGGSALITALIIFCLVIPSITKGTQKNNLSKDLNEYLTSKCHLNIDGIVLEEKTDYRGKFDGYYATVTCDNLTKYSYDEMTSIMYYEDIDGVTIKEFICNGSRYDVNIETVYLNGKKVYTKENHTWIPIN